MDSYSNKSDSKSAYTYFHFTESNTIDLFWSDVFHLRFVIWFKEEDIILKSVHFDVGGNFKLPGFVSPKERSQKEYLN